MLPNTPSHCSCMPSSPGLSSSPHDPRAHDSISSAPTPYRVTHVAPNTRPSADFRADGATTYRCAVAVGVWVRKGPIPSGANLSKTVIKNKATIIVLPDTVTAGGREYLALSDGSGFVPLHKPNGSAAFLTIDQYTVWGGEDGEYPMHMMRRPCLNTLHPRHAHRRESQQQPSCLFCSPCT